MNPGRSVVSKINLLLLTIMLCVTSALADQVYSGTVRFFVDGQGRAAVLLDQSNNGSTDGYADQLFLLANATALTQTINTTITSATVTYSGNRVLVTTSNQSVLIDLSTSSSAGPGSGTTIYRFLSAVELSNYGLGNNTLMSSFSTVPYDSGLLSQWADGGDGCDSGGKGSVSCSNGGVGGCSVSCAPGYYACCKQTGNSCKCNKD